jgi:hypothetical protein
LTHDIEVLELATEKDRVIDGHKRREVLVERGGLHPEATGHLGQTEAVDPLLGHHVLGYVEDLFDGLLAASGPPIKRSRRLALGRDSRHTRDRIRSLA